MKISSASKKVLASALSAAMVVAFAPTVAMASVFDDNGGDSATEKPALSGDTVATVSWQATKGGQKYTVTQEFKATDEASFDNAVQSAFAFAAAPAKEGYATATAPKTVVQLQKDVAVDAPSGVVFTHDTATGEWVAETSGTAAANIDYYKKNEDGTYTKATVTTGDSVAGLYKVVGTSVVDPDVEVAGALKADGEFTLDLNGHKLTNTANVKVGNNGALKGTEDGVVVVDKYTAEGVKKIAGQAVTKNVYLATSAVSDWNDINAVKDKIKAAIDDIAPESFQQLEGTYNKTGQSADGTPTYTKVTGNTPGAYYGYTVTYTTGDTYDDKTAASEAKVTFTDSQKSGAIESTNATAIESTSGTVTLGDVAVSASEGEGVKVGTNAKAVDAAAVDVTGAAAVTAKALATTAAVKGTAVSVKEGGSLTASAESTAAASNGYAAAVEAGTYSIDKKGAADLSAKANGASADEGNGGSIVDPGTGVVDPNGSATAAATGVHSFAVKAGTVHIKAGKYSAEYAVASAPESKYGGDGKVKLESTAPTTSGDIAYGEFTGHVYGQLLDAATSDAASGKVTVSGGIFSESPKATETAKVYNAAGTAKVTKFYGNEIAADHAVATDGSKYYVYKSAAGTGSEWKGYESWRDASAVSDSNYLIKVGEVEKPAEGKAIADWAKATVESLATGKSVDGISLTGTDAAAVQKALIDGNVAVADGRVSLQVTPARVDATYKKNTDAQKQLLSDIDKVADEQSQSVQGVYTISAQLNQGVKTGEAVKIADVNDMGDTKVNVTVRPVTANTEAQVAYADGKTAALTIKGAVTNGQSMPGSFETSSLASFGIIYSTPADAIKRADKAAAKVVTDEIAKIAADYATVDAKNYEAALAAVAEAEKDYSKLTDAQKKYVTEEQLASIAQVKTAAEAVKAAQPAAKKANTAKVSKKKLTVKVGKKGTFKVTGAKGKVTVKSSAKKKATASISGKKVTVKGLKKGKATVTVKAAGNASYKAKTVTVTVTVK